MMPRCDEIDELLAAFALDAVDADERILVLEHLAECRLHDEALAMYRDVAGMLPLALEDRQPAPSARDSLLAAFEAEVGTPTPITRAPAPEPIRAPARPAAQTPTPLRNPVAAPAPRSGLGLFRMPALGYGLAAALLVVALGMGAWNLSLQGDDRNLSARIDVAEDGKRLQLYYLEDDSLAVLKLDLPPLAPGRVYQAWKLVGGQPTSMGVLPGSGLAAMPADFADASAIAISVEPAGGSVAPTTTPVLIAEL